MTVGENFGNMYDPQKIKVEKKVFFTKFKCEYNITYIIDKAVHVLHNGVLHKSDI